MWEVVRLGEVCKFENGDRGKNYPSKKHQVTEGIPFINAGDLSSEGCITTSDMAFITEERYDLLGAGKIQIDDILFCLRGSLGKCALNRDIAKGAIASSLVIMRPDTDVLSPRFLLYFLQSDLTTEQIARTAGGTAQPNLSAKVVRDYEIPLPPLAEQQRIVAKLDAAFAEIDRAIELAKGCKENTARFYSHTIDALFNEYANQADNLGELSAINYGYTAKASHEEGSYKILRITDIQENTVDWEHVPFCEVEEKKLEKVLLHDGDIVFARTGATTGKSFLVEKPKDAVFASYLIRVSVDRERLIPRYVMHYFHSASYWEQVEKGISGAAQGGFNATKLAELKIPVVAKKIQQALIAKLDDALESSKALDAIYAKKTHQVSHLKSAILAQELQPPQSEAA